MSSVVYDYVSDQDQQDPGGYYGGFKEGLIRESGVATRSLSHPTTGDWTGSQFRYVLNDPRKLVRQQLASPVDRYWVGAEQVFMTTRANRAILGTPYTVFVGPIVDAQPIPPLAWEITLGDVVSHGLLSDRKQLPWRLVRDGFLDRLLAIADDLDLDTPEPIIYGRHRRVINQGTPELLSADGFEVTPTYLGIETVGGVDKHVWIVAAHACKDIPDVNTVDADGVHLSMIPDEGIDWMIPHHAAFDGAFGAPYRDIRSSTFGNDRRYTLIYGNVGAENPDKCALGELTLTCFVYGVEDVGDGTGELIIDRIQQYEHFLINYVAHSGADSYQSGDWLANPTWDLFDGPVPIVEEASFDACTAIGEERLPAFGSPSLDPAGYIGAAIIGARPGDVASVKKWIADWNRSCGVRFGVTHYGQLRVAMVHPTQAIKDAARLYLDQYEMLEGTFGTDVGWRDQSNRIPFRADYEHTSGQWKTSDVADADDSIVNYEKEILGEVREYPFAPGITAAFHLAHLEALQLKHPPRVISFESAVGPHYNNQSLGYLDLGDYIRYQHYAEVGSAAQIRLAQVVSHQVQAGKRRVRVECLDVEDLIGYDAPPVYDEVGSPGVINDTCANAIDVGGEGEFQFTVDTTGRTTDPSFPGGSPALFCGSGVAYNPAWFKYTPTFAAHGHVQTHSSSYDTVLSMWRVPTGDPCSGMELVDCNDNDGILNTSFLDVTFFDPFYDYYFLCSGYGPTDAGTLIFTFYSELD